MHQTSDASFCFARVRSSSSALAISASKSCRDAVGTAVGAVFAAVFFFPMLAEIQVKQ
jgi:hypothetical protein